MRVRSRGHAAAPGSRSRTRGRGSGSLRTAWTRWPARAWTESAIADPSACGSLATPQRFAAWSAACQSRRFSTASPRRSTRRATRPSPRPRAIVGESDARRQIAPAQVPPAESRIPDSPRRDASVRRLRRQTIQRRPDGCRQLQSLRVGRVGSIGWRWPGSALVDRALDGTPLYAARGELPSMVRTSSSVTTVGRPQRASRGPIAVTLVGAGERSWLGASARVTSRCLASRAAAMRSLPTRQAPGPRGVSGRGHPLPAVRGVAWAIRRFGSLRSGHRSRSRCRSRR